jgi:hypothetical protein
LGQQETGRFVSALVETGLREWPLIAMPSLLCFDLWSSPNPRDRRCNWRFLGIFASAQAEEIRFPIPALSAARTWPYLPALSAARTWPYREIRNDIERLWHDAAMHKARVFLGLERKLLDLSLVIQGYFLVILSSCFPFFLAQCSNLPHFNGGLVASPSSPRKIVRDGYLDNLGSNSIG